MLYMLWIALAIVFAALLITYGFSYVFGRLGERYLESVKHEPFRYNFTIDNISIEEKHFIEESGAEHFVHDDKLKHLQTTLRGLPISVVVDEHEGYPNRGARIAKSKAEIKASEVIAIALGLEYTTSRKRGDGDITGKLAECKLISIEQI